MDPPSEPMVSWWTQIPLAERFVIVFAGLAGFVAIGIYCFSKLKQTIDDTGKIDEWSTIRELHEDGHLRDYEYAHLRKTVAADRLAAEKPQGENVADETRVTRPDAPASESGS